MGKKINVFRENDVVHLRDYLIEAVREVLYEAEEGSMDQAQPTEPEDGDSTSDLQPLIDLVVANIKKGIAKLKLLPEGEEFDDSNVVVSDRSIRLNVPAGGERPKLAPYIKNAIEKYIKSLGEKAENLSITDVGSSSGLLIGHRIKKGSHVVAQVDMKPLRGFGVRNKGDVAEGILAASVAAAFMKGVKVSATQLLAELDKQADSSTKEKQVAKSLTKKIKREDGTEDIITLDIRLAKVNFNDLMDLRKRGDLEGLFNSSNAYAKSGEVLDAQQAIAVDQNPSKLTVLADGVGDQKGTKVDVRIFMENPETGAHEEIPIGRISLKAGATKQLGQVGNTWDAMAGTEGMFMRMFGVQPDEGFKAQWEAVLTNPKRGTKGFEVEIKKVARVIYEDALKKIQNYITQGDSDPHELKFFQRLSNGTKYQAVLEEKGVRLIQLSKGTFKVLDFDLLGDLSKEGEDNILKDVNLSVRMREEDKGDPKIIIFDADSKEGKGDIVSMRVKVEGSGKTIRHYIEKQDHLVDLINIAKKDEKEAEEVA